MGQDQRSGDGSRTGPATLPEGPGSRSPNEPYPRAVERGWAPATRRGAQETRVRAPGPGTREPRARPCTPRAPPCSPPPRPCLPEPDASETAGSARDRLGTACRAGSRQPTLLQTGPPAQVTVRDRPGGPHFGAPCHSPGALTGTRHCFRAENTVMRSHLPSKGLRLRKGVYPGKRPGRRSARVSGPSTGAGPGFTMGSEKRWVCPHT